MRQARAHSGMSQDDLALAAGVSRKSVQDAERGKVPKARLPYTLPRIAAALGWPEGSIESILEGEGPPGEWRDVPTQGVVDAQLLGEVISQSLLRATEHTTAAEIRRATHLALNALREHGVIADAPQGQQESMRNDDH